MDKQQTIDLWKKGKEAWNAWAQQMLAERKALEDSGRWEEETEEWEGRATANFLDCRFGDGELSSNFMGNLFPHNVWFIGATFIGIGSTGFEFATFMGSASFCRVVFNGNVNFNKATFSGFVLFDNAAFTGNASFGATFGATFKDWTAFKKVTFTNNANFSEATFRGNANFSEATFTKDAEFFKATFEGNAKFKKATFESAAEFNEATFLGDALFEETTFLSTGGFDGAKFIYGTCENTPPKSGTVKFDTATFEKPASFKEVQFHKETTFVALNVHSAFDMAEATFTCVPDFTQAHFVEAPRLDNLTITPPSGYKPQEHDASRYRALRRMATQGHDHERELTFFANEIIARRGYVDHPWHVRWWLGLLYEASCDFGRSIVRPCVWLGLLWLWSGNGYLQMCTRPVCDVFAPYLLSFKNTAPYLFAGQDTQRLYVDIYGKHTPYEVMALGGVQTLVGGVLIFLLLLGIRNMLRVK